MKNTRILKLESCHKCDALRVYNISEDYGEYCGTDIGICTKMEPNIVIAIKNREDDSDFGIPDFCPLPKFQEVEE